MALAQKWQDLGGTALLAMAQSNPPIQQRLEREGIPSAVLGVPPLGPADALATRELARRMSARWTLADGYGFDGDWLDAARASRVALWTDFVQSPRLPVDLLINQNPHAVPGDYLPTGAARLLLGLDYVVLRRDFLAMGRARRARMQLERILVTFGGGAVREPYLNAIAALSQPTLSGCHVMLMVGQNNPHRPEIMAAARGRSHMTVMDAADNFAEIASSCDIALTAAGATLWELASLGLPSVALSLAPNQTPLAHHLALAGAGIDLGDALAADAKAMAAGILRVARDLAQFSLRAASLVDGAGSSRVCNELMLQA